MKAKKGIITDIGKDDAYINSKEKLIGKIIIPINMHPSDKNSNYWSGEAITYFNHKLMSLYFFEVSIAFDTETELIEQIINIFNREAEIEKEVYGPEDIQAIVTNLSKYGKQELIQLLEAYKRDYT